MGWDQLKWSLQLMRLQCHVACEIFTAVQLAWFVQIITVTVKHMKKSKPS